MKREKTPGARRPRVSPRTRMTLLALSLAIPVLLITTIGIGSVSRQKQTRALQWRGQWQRQLELSAAGLERALDRSIAAVFDSLEREPLDPGRPLQIQQRLKNLLALHPVVTYPFVITAEREYLFPFTRPMIAAPTRSYLSNFSSNASRGRFQAGENHEFGDRNWLAAIREFLAGTGLVATPRERAVFSLAIGRCYFKWGKYPQAVPYLRDVLDSRGLNVDQDHFLFMEARQLLALAYDRMGDTDMATDCYLGLYEHVLALQAASQSVQLEFFKNEALEFLNRQTARTTAMKERLAQALKKEHLEKIASQEISLRWQFFTIPELEAEGTVSDRQWLEARRLQQIREFYLVDDEKKLFYTRLQKNFLPATPEAETKSALRTEGGFIRQADLGVAYAPLAIENMPVRSMYFGFQIAMAHVQQILLPLLQRKYWPPTGPVMVLASVAEAGSMATDGLPQLKLEQLLPGHVLAVKAPHPGYLDALIRKEMLISYLLIVSLLLTLLAVGALFFRSLRRDMELLELKNSFLDNAAHTLKTPLARIRLLSEQLQLDWLKNDQQRAAQPGKIIAETERMNDLVANLLDFSRIEAGQKTYSFQEASIAEVAGQAWAEALPLLKESGFTCRCEIATDLPESRMDARALRLVIGNLIQNALCYSPDRKEIELRVYRSGSEAVLEVADRGLGIAPQFQQEIFEKFFRIENDATSSRGSGLGLFLVKHAVTAHGGRIEVKSALGQGARFVIHLPLAVEMKDTCKKGSC